MGSLGICALTAALLVCISRSGTSGAHTDSSAQEPVHIDQVPTNLVYSFILVNHAMVFPTRTTSTFPNDSDRKRRWMPGYSTHKGRQLMSMVGHSLKYRYLQYLNVLNGEDTRFTRLGEEYYNDFLNDLGKGLLAGTNLEPYRPTKSTDYREYWSPTDYDGAILSGDFKGNGRFRCNWLDVIMAQFDYEQIDQCTATLYQTLRQSIQKPKQKLKPTDEWYINSPEQVYNLWKIIQFQVYNGLKHPRWYKSVKTEMNGCVAEFYRRLVTWHPDIPTLIAGQLVKDIQDDLTDGFRLHMHVGNDLMLWTMQLLLANGQASEPPNYGDALIFEFFSDKSMKVSTFSPSKREFKTIQTSETRSILDDLKKRGVYLDEPNWFNICHYTCGITIDSITKSPGGVCSYGPAPRGVISSGRSAGGGGKKLKTRQEVTVTETESRTKTIVRIPGQPKKQAPSSEYSGEDSNDYTSSQEVPTELTHSYKPPREPEPSSPAPESYRDETHGKQSGQQRESLETSPQKQGIFGVLKSTYTDSDGVPHERIERVYSNAEEFYAHQDEIRRQKADQPPSF